MNRLSNPREHLLQAEILRDVVGKIITHLLQIHPRGNQFFTFLTFVCRDGNLQTVIDAIDSTSVLRTPKQQRSTFNLTGHPLRNETLHEVMGKTTTRRYISMETSFFTFLASLFCFYSRFRDIVQDDRCGILNTSCDEPGRS